MKCLILIVISLVSSSLGAMNTLGTKSAEGTLAENRESRAAETRSSSLAQLAEQDILRGAAVNAELTNALSLLGIIPADIKAMIKQYITQEVPEERIAYIIPCQGRLCIIERARGGFYASLGGNKVKNPDIMFSKKLKLPFERARSASKPGKPIVLDVNDHLTCSYRPSVGSQFPTGYDCSGTLFHVPYRREQHIEIFEELEKEFNDAQAAGAQRYRA